MTNSLIYPRLFYTAALVGLMGVLSLRNPVPPKELATSFAASMP
jgi:hypothetical protein